MVFKIELPFPHRKPFVSFHTILQLVKVGAGKLLPHLRNPLDPLLHTDRGFQHLPGRAAAPVPIAVGDQDIVVNILILIAHPSAHDSARMKHSVIGGEKIGHGLFHIQSSDQVSQHLRAVDPPPPHGIIGHLVKLVPGKLRGHEIVDSALFHDLGQGSRIPEHVRQPENPVIHPKLLPEKPLSMHKLAYQRLSGGQVAVRLHPHTALRLPASLPDTLLELLIQLRVALLQEDIELRLAGHKFVIRVFLHELKHSRKASCHLLPGLGHSPPPGNVDMGMSDTGGDHVTKARHLRIQSPLNIGRCLIHSAVKFLRVRRAQIQKIHRIIQDLLDLLPVSVVLLHPAKG